MCHLYIVEIHLIFSEERKRGVLCQKKKKTMTLYKGVLSGCLVVARRLLDLLLTSLYYILVLGPSVQVCVIYRPSF